jgi:hypothetical protein
VPQANFYSWAAYGYGLEALNLTGGGPPAVGGKKALLSLEGQAYAESIARVGGCMRRWLPQAACLTSGWRWLLSRLSTEGRLYETTWQVCMYACIMIDVVSRRSTAYSACCPLPLHVHVHAATTHTLAHVTQSLVALTPCTHMPRPQDEINHVALLRAALGDKAVPQPLIDIGPAFAAAAGAAFGAELNVSFDPYGSDILFYHGAFIFEDVGVNAYKVS